MVFKIYAQQQTELHNALITAKYYGIHIEVPHFNAGDESSPEFLAKNPAGKTPTLETDEGVIFESNAIVRYIARVGGDKAHLYGKTAFEAGLVDQWIDFAASSIDLPALSWTLPIEGLIPNNGLATKKAGEDIKRVFQILDSHLLTRTYLVGNRISIADIVVASSLVRLFELVLDPAFRSGFVNATRWFTTIVNQPNFLAVKGNIKLAEKVAVPPTKEKKPKEEKPKEEKPKQEKPKKQEKVEEPAQGNDEEEEEEDRPKKKNPLDELPKSNFIMDEWKRFYSNNETKASIPWFHEHYDPAGYSLYWCTYRYSNELTNDPIYKINNLIGGWFQRLETLHKYAFSTVNIYGVQGEGQQIHGVWLFRGHDVPADMKDCDDSEVFEFTRADLNDPAQKKKFEEFLSWEGEVNGLKFNSGKLYK